MAMSLPASESGALSAFSCSINFNQAGIFNVICGFKSAAWAVKMFVAVSKAAIECVERQKIIDKAHSSRTHLHTRTLHTNGKEFRNSGSGPGDTLYLMARNYRPRITIREETIAK